MAGDPDTPRPSVILVADRTLSADYKVLFEGIFATMQTTQAPGLIMRTLLSPRVRTDAAGRAATAPLGIRRVESSLVDAGVVGPDEVVCTTPEALERLLGPWAKVVAVSSSDPLGRGMSNTTTQHFCRGELYTRTWTDRMMLRLRSAKDEFGFRVVAGGGGAWQWAQNPDDADRHGIDCVFDGYFEDKGPGLFVDLLAGEPAPAHVREAGCAAGNVRPIRAPSTMGVVEISRGCGKGCRFCSSAAKSMQHLPVDTIIADLETNVAGGVTAVASGSEDFFRYGATGATVNFPALRELLLAMRKVRGLSFMQIDHGNVSSVMQFDDEQLREIRELLTWEKHTDYLWVNMGIESASGRLVHANAPGKIAPFDPDDWGEIVREAIAKMTRTGFFPVLSVILGLPGETADDVRATLDLVNDVADKPCVIFPIFHEPVDPAARDRGEAFSVASMHADHLALFSACYEINFRRVPLLVRDNQAAGGVSWFKRTLLQVLGKTEIVTWRRRFKKLSRTVSPAPAGRLVQVSEVATYGT